MAMANPKGKETDTETEDAERKPSLAARNVRASVQYHEPILPDSPAAATPQLTREKSSRLGTAPELALGNLRASKKARAISTVNVAPPVPLKLRPGSVSVVAVAPTSGSNSEAAAEAAGPAATSIGPPPPAVPAGPSFRPRPKPAPPKSGGFSFGSCFGGPTSPPPRRILPPQSLPRKPPSRRASISDSAKPGVTVVVPAEVGKETVTDSTVNKPQAASTVSADTNAPSGATPAASRSPSCRCASLVPTETTAVSTTKEPGSQNSPASIAGESALAMNNIAKVENDPGNSSGQQVLNAQSAVSDLIAAVQRADRDSSERQAQAGASPIRGLRRPNRTDGVPTRPRRHKTAPAGFHRYGSRPSGGLDREYHNNLKPPQLRTPAYNNYRPPGGQYASPATANGIARLFDAIIGPGFVEDQEYAGPGEEYAEQDAGQEQAHAQQSRALALIRAKNYPRKQRTKHLKAAVGPNVSSAKDHRLAKSRGILIDSLYHRLAKLPNYPLAAPNPQQAESSASTRDQPRPYYDRGFNYNPETRSKDQPGYSDRPNYPETSSREQGYADQANYDPEPSSSGQDLEYFDANNPDQTTSRDQEYESAAYDDTKAGPQDGHQLQRDTGLAASGLKLEKKDPNQPVPDEGIRRRRGYPDPSFNPRPGDIIIRARKRSGLRLTDFYYYDNENYMEQGDQILRAKFEYLPPMDTMYLWCRLYVYGADGGYTYLDSTSEVVGKFRSGPDIKTFKQPARFM